MNFDKIKQKNTLLTVVSEGNLFQKLIKQVEKDLELVGITDYFESNLSPEVFFSNFKELLTHLIDSQFEIFLHVLYRIDIDEYKIREIIAKSQIDVYEEITFLILKREWQKVWYKENYSN